MREALALGRAYIGPEHILLGLVGEMPNSGLSILCEFDVDPNSIRAKVLESVRDREPDSDGFSGALVSDGGTAIPARLGTIPTHADRPAINDSLGRTRLAEVLGERIRRVRGEDTEVEVFGELLEQMGKRAADRAAAQDAGSFMVHIHAPWGAGKSSLLNLLAVDLRNRRGSAFNPSLSQWIVTEFSAWRHQRLASPWWWMLAAIRRSCTRDLWRMSRVRWAWFWLRDIAWRAWNFRVTLFTVLTLAAIFGIAEFFEWFGLQGAPLTTVQTIALTASAVATLGTGLWGIVRGTSALLALGSAEGAARFLRRAHDPLGAYQRRFRWLVRSSGRPIAVFIDDLDRCDASYVVELLEGIQTIFAGEPVTYVIAADRSWLCQSYATAYGDFSEVVGEQGRPLGFLFLEKTFQISLELPPMSYEDKVRYWQDLTAGQEGRQPDGQFTFEGSYAFADASTHKDVESRVETVLALDLDPPAREELLRAAVRRLNAPELRRELEQSLGDFADMIENNPRSMKRLLNAYGLERDCLLREGRLLTAEEQGQLIRFSILRLRWPLLAEHLLRCPEDVAYCINDRVPNGHRFAPLFEDADVRLLFDRSSGNAALDSASLERFAGRAGSGRPSVGA